MALDIDLESLEQRAAFSKPLSEALNNAFERAWAIDGRGVTVGARGEAVEIGLEQGRMVAHPCARPVVRLVGHAARGSAAGEPD